ncbi:MAG: alpha-N-acetylglucosaminidase [Rikenellaceae bacterium]
MIRKFLILLFLVLGSTFQQSWAAKEKNPVSALVDRIDNGASKHFLFEISDPMCEVDFFELDSKGSKVWIKGNNWISVAAGLNWYLKYHAGVHIAWNSPRQRILDFPKVKTPERHETSELLRYYLNYCTFSYSMAWWDWKRWEREIDWMALHGINMPLALTGTSTVWRNTLLELGYTKDEANAFVASPSKQAWWLMNNLEGSEVPNSDDWYNQQVALEQLIVARYKQWGIKPVYAGYAGMVPSDANEKLGLEVQDPGTWCAYQRPAFLQPTDPRFAEIARVYYQQMEKLFGKADYYSIDPFHEGGSTAGVDLAKAGEAIFGAMKEASEGAKWVIQAWQNNPQPAMIEAIPAGELIVLDLFSESRPQWGDMQSTWYREGGYGAHDWIYCMLLNFGGNTGMYGKMQRVIDGYYLTKRETVGQYMVGVGATMEGIENNPVMYELIYELPWRKETFTKEQWIENWAAVRYGRASKDLTQAWNILANTVYNPPYDATQEGTSESVFCARPALEVDNVSTWGTSKLYYKPAELEKALHLMIRESEVYRGSNNFEYDLVDVARQTLANRGSLLLGEIRSAFDLNDTLKFDELTTQFLDLILMQDQLLNSREEFMVGPWVASAMLNGRSQSEMENYRKEALTLISTWGNHTASNQGGLHDYSHREWAGVLKNLYYQRWKSYFDYAKEYKELPINYDFYDMEAQWAASDMPYALRPSTDAVDQARQVAHYLRMNPIN